MRNVFLFSALLLTQIANASGTSIRGGGDDAGLDFQAHLVSALENLKANNPVLYKKVAATELRTQPRVIVVDDAQDVQFRDLIQSSVATNDPARGEVYLNRKRWNDLNDSVLKEGIALHENLSLRGLERTGYYPISSQYVAVRGGAKTELANRLQVNRVRQISAQKPGQTPGQILMDLFNEAKDRISTSDIPTTHDVVGNKTKLRCQSTSPNGTYLSEVTIGRISVITAGYAPAVDHGPLFPPTPEQQERREPRLVVFRDRDEMRACRDNIYLEDCPDWWGAYVNDSLRVTSTEIQQTADWPEDRDMNFDLKGRKYRWTFRKNNGMIVFRHTVKTKHPVHDIDLVGYCYEDQNRKP